MGWGGLLGLRVETIAPTPALHSSRGGKQQEIELGRNEVGHWTKVKLRDRKDTAGETRPRTNEDDTEAVEQHLQPIAAETWGPRFWSYVEQELAGGKDACGEPMSLVFFEEVGGELQTEEQAGQCRIPACVQNQHTARIHKEKDPSDLARCGRLLLLG